ncbi:hypothetical protein C0Q70_20044 [Pomacea canaliculata]|uniref:Uncharacterized protein n=1 Tax=Pomacea canaliculata TaxID=400727 RepID=A0A2T7NEE7_POMCA|nr:hypothetical protein C0Q70_20044 [Pomacea canaliculata]
MPLDLPSVTMAMHGHQGLLLQCPRAAQQNSLAAETDLCDYKRPAAAATTTTTTTTTTTPRWLLWRVHKQQSVYVAPDLFSNTHPPSVPRTSPFH